jgi:hypothetical protein
MDAAKTPAEWLEWYEKHGGSRELELDESELTCFNPEKGFITFLTHDDILELHHLCGDGKFWQNELVKIMKYAGLEKLRAFTRRSPKAWARKYGGHIRGWYMEADLDELEKTL